MEPTPGPERISRRLREQFAPAYLAITGLVQVLVLDALISKVEDNYTEYGVVDWLVTAATFLVCMDIWHEYLMTVLSHVWPPGLLDSLVPFAFLVTELLMVHFVGEDLRGWCSATGWSPWSAWPPGPSATSASASSPTRNATCPWPW